MLLLGRRTWELFSTRWPGRSGEFPDLMNRCRKVVATTSLDDLSAWTNSSVLDGTLEEGIADLRQQGDVVVVGSTSVVRALAAADLVDEYRVIVIPIVVGAGNRLFLDDQRLELQVATAEQRGTTVHIRYARP